MSIHVPVSVPGYVAYFTFFSDSKNAFVSFFKFTSQKAINKCLARPQSFEIMSS